jgi:hypothetical protein
VPRHPRSEPPESRWGGPPVAFVAVLALAGVLRLTGIKHVRPSLLLGSDERNIVPRAWSIVHGGGLDPRWFDHPSLVLYLLAPFQAWQDEPSYLAARLTVVVLALGGVAAAWWLGQRAYGTTAGFVAAAVTAVETTHVAYSRIAVPDVPLTLGVAVALGLMISGRIELAGLVVGLAASAKYPGVLLLAPLLVSSWGAWRRLAVAGGLALVAFAATSPYVILHLGQAAGDAWRVQTAPAGRFALEHDQAAPVAFVARLWDGLGPALVIAAVGLVLALVYRRRADLVLAVFVLVYFAYLLTLHAQVDRYVLPLVPALGALAGRFRALAPVTILMLVIPLTWAVRDAKDLTRGDALGRTPSAVARDLAEERPGDGVPVLGHRLQLRRCLRKRDVDDGVAVQGGHHAETALVHEIGRLEAEAGCKHPVPGGRAPSALDVAEHRDACLEAGLLLDLAC